MGKKYKLWANWKMAMLPEERVEPIAIKITPVICEKDNERTRGKESFSTLLTPAPILAWYKLYQAKLGTKPSVFTVKNIIPKCRSAPKITPKATPLTPQKGTKIII